MITVIYLLVLVIVFLSYKLYEYYKWNQLFETVKWFVYCDSFKGKPEDRMLNYILHLQNELSIDEKYRFAEDELNTINKIFLNFLQDVIKRYFNRSSLLVESKFSEEDNFVIRLTHFLESHQTEQDFNDSIAYHKLYYTSLLHYLKLYNIVDDGKLGVIQAKLTKETIDSMLEKEYKEVATWKA